MRQWGAAVGGPPQFRDGGPQPSDPNITTILIVLRGSLAAAVADSIPMHVAPLALCTAHGQRRGTVNILTQTSQQLCECCPGFRFFMLIIRRNQHPDLIHTKVSSALSISILRAISIITNTKHYRCRYRQHRLLYYQFHKILAIQSSNQSDFKFKIRILIHEYNHEYTVIQNNLIIKVKWDTHKDKKKECND